MRQHGKENFKFSILQEVSIAELDVAESYYIDKLDTLVPNGYNLIHSDTTRRESELSNRIKYMLRYSTKTAEVIAEDVGVTGRMVSYINTGRAWVTKGETYPIREVGAVRPQPKKYYCTCGKEKSRRAKNCKDCRHVVQRRKRIGEYRSLIPTEEELQHSLIVKGFTNTAKYYGVSNTAVRKWCIKYGMSPYAADYK